MADPRTLTADTQEAYEALEDFARSIGLQWELRSTLRSCDQQNALFSIGRDTPGRVVTGARGCMSWHVLGRAFDITLPGSGRADYERLGEFWESMGGVWGGRFTNIDDVGHYEWHPGMTIEQVCPNPSACESAVEQHRAEAARAAKLPLGGMFAVAGIAAAAMIWWRG